MRQPDWWQGEYVPLAAPGLGRPAARIAIGAVVGIAAAALLPILKASLGLP